MSEENKVSPKVDKPEISHISDKSMFNNKSDAGKGDSPRNISRKFWDNYDQINWHHGGLRPEYAWSDPDIETKKFKIKFTEIH